MAAVLKHFEIPANTEGSVTAKCKQCTQIIAGSTKVTSISVKHLKVRISSLFTSVVVEWEFWNRFPKAEIRRKTGYV